MELAVEGKTSLKIPYKFGKEKESSKVAKHKTRFMFVFNNS